jgi:hypothetical protein
MRVIAAATLFTILVMGTGTSSGQPGEPAKQSRFRKGVAEFRESGFDFGKVPQQTAACKRFHVVNVGTDTLEILDVKTGCGCTKAPISKKLIGAGDSTEIEIIFSTGNRTGPYSKSTRVETSDLLSRVANLKIAAYVYPQNVPTSPVVSDPKVLETSRSDPMANVKLKNITTSPLGVRLAYFDEQFTDVSLSASTIGPGETITAAVKIAKDRLSAGFEKSFTLQFDDKDHSRMTIPIVYGAAAGTSAKK